MTTNVNPLLVEAIAAEYEYSQKLNKRSRLWKHIYLQTR
jgi:hypothetical protein